MNGLDYGLLVILALGLALGYARGFIGQLVSFTGFFVACIVAILGYSQVAPWIKSVMNLSGHETFSRYELLAQELRVDTYVYNVLAFGLLLLGTKLAFAIAGRVLNWLAAAPGIKTFNKWGGALLGLLEAALLALLVVHVMTVWPSDTAQRLLSTSTSAPYVVEHTPVWADKLKQLWENRKESNEAAKSRKDYGQEVQNAQNVTRPVQTEV
ncbi:CvpA family protein [Paenibacillus puerhi]|uniref:CvpA family protein n=1 Tax=Paenibacillus puerhi TaxID=2692622 RepID=UPI00135A9685|nr:CvpA family protein [Paenibacillus puerhi]